MAEFAVAAVQGLQGDRLDAEDSLLATLKHFAGYGASEGGRNGAPVHMGLRELHEIDLLPFRKAVEAGAQSVMTAYNEIDGVPCTSSRYLLHDVLREAWGFDGFVITDCGAIDMLKSGHNTAASGRKPRHRLSRPASIWRCRDRCSRCIYGRHWSRDISPRTT